MIRSGSEKMSNDTHSEKSFGEGFRRQKDNYIAEIRWNWLNSYLKNFIYKN